MVQVFEIRLIQALLESCEDPDAYFCNWWATGVWLGSPKRRLPRTPAVFDRKTKWRLAEPTEQLHGEWQCNYPSLKEHVSTVQAQFEEEEKKGWMRQMTVADAIREWGPELVIAATGAIAKKGKEGEVRVIYDGSNGIKTNPGIRVRDQVKYPIAQDGKAVLSECAEEGGPHYSIQIEFPGAHRQVDVVREDWGRQVCQVRGTAAEASKAMKKIRAEAERKDFESTGRRAVLKPRKGIRQADLSEEVLKEIVWVIMVGTFGIASA